MEDGSPDAAKWLGLDRRSFVATACINQAQLLGVLDEADGMQKILQRASTTAGADATAAEALARLEAFQKSQVGRDDARSIRPMRQAVLALDAATVSLGAARLEHVEYLRAVEEVDRLRATAADDHRELALYEPAAARKLADDYATRCARAAVLRVRLGESPPPALTQTDALGTQVARALEAWAKRPQPSELTGPSAEELADRIAALPEMPNGDLTVDPSVRAANDELSGIKAVLGAQAATAPTAPEATVPGVTQDEAVSLAQALEMGRHATPVLVRFIDYTLDDGRAESGPYRLLTTILDPSDASGEQLALAYAERWEIESAFDELKTHQRGPKTVLRSKSPELVHQEIWGHLCCHYAIRTLMWEAAEHAVETPTGYRSWRHYEYLDAPFPSGALFPPHDADATDHLWRRAIAQLIARLNPTRRSRSNPRVIKRKMPKWHVKRSWHVGWPQPTAPLRGSIHSP
jgi:hypothetical protein